jgi:hypothetical protein
MARLLRDNDYLRLIQADNLAQIIESNQQIKLDTEQSAQAEMISYLSQRYVVDEVFRDTKVFDLAAVYKAKQLFEYTDVQTYASATHYNTDDRVTYNSNIYKCLGTDVHGAFNPDEWELICADKTLFYALTPKPEYSALVTYAIGDEIFYKDKTYTCVKACINILPTVSEFWGTGTSYSVTGFYPENTTYYTQGDNRNQLIVMRLIDITLYHLHSRINPRNIPDLRKDRYDGNRDAQTLGAIGWLKQVAAGKINADLPNIVPEQGLAMRYGTSSTYDKNTMW